MKNNAYWQERMVLLEGALLSKGQKYLQDIEREYRTAAISIEKDIARWYQRFADNNLINMAEAKRLLNTKELEEFKWSIYDYIKYGEENALNGRWMKQLENASARVHISRLESLRLQMQHQVEVLYGNQVDDIDKLMRKVYQDGYYHTAWEIQKGFNIGWSLHAIEKGKLDRIISKPWSADGKTFSQRLWDNQLSLITNLQTDLTQSVITGKNPKDLINGMAARLNKDKNKTGRLVMTEAAAFSSAAQKDCYNDLDVERYEIVATLDNHTSEICQDLDGEVFDMKDYEVGSTAPPFHPWCRTVTAPYFDDNYGERIARDLAGKTYYVPSDMKYKEWKEAFVDNGSNSINLIIGTKTITDITISGVSNHATQRAFERGITNKDIVNALQNPLKIGKIKQSTNGVNQEFLGEVARVHVNPETGKIITLWKTSSKKLKKLKDGGK